MKLSKKTVSFIVLIAVVIVGVKLIQNKKASIESDPTAFIHSYKPLDKVSENKQDSFELYTAKLEADENPQITTKISGFIDNIFVKENDIVKKGDKLIAIDSGEFESSLKQLEYSLQSIKSTIDSMQKSINSLELDMKLSLDIYKSNKKIYDAGGISKEKLEQSQIVYEQKNAKYLSTLDQIAAKKFELRSQKALLASKQKLKPYYTLYAPIDGTIENVALSNGDMTSVNKPIISLLSKKQKLTFTFASDLIKKGQGIYIDDQKIGVISFISPSAKNYLKVANIDLKNKLELPINSMVSIKVRIK